VEEVKTLAVAYYTNGERSLRHAKTNMTKFPKFSKFPKCQA